MNILSKTYAYLQKIMNKEESFIDVLNRSIPSGELNQDEAKLIRDGLKSAVNRYYYLRYELRRGARDLHFESDETSLLVLGLAFIQYVKNVTIEDVLKWLEEDYDSLPLRASLEQIREIYTSIGDHPLELPQKLDDHIRKKICLRYSYPEWVVKMMLKQFGVKNTYKSAASTRRGLPIVINKNPLRFKEGKDVLSEEDFKKTTFSSRAYSYVGKDKIINHPYFRSNRIFVEDESYQILVDLLNPEQGEEMLFIDESKGIMAIDAALKVNDLAKINVVCNDLYVMESLNNLTKRFRVSSLKYFESTPNLLITHISPNSMDKVLVVPDSSRLGLIRRQPDVLLTLKKKDLGDIISAQTNLLNEASQFVKEEGTLIYSVFTMNIKESVEVINEFLSSHSDFSLEEQKQIFPYEGPTDGFYYAKLKRNKKQDED